MKLVNAIIAPHRASQVIHALRGLPHFPGYTLLTGTGESRGHGEGGSHLPSETDIDARSNLVLLIACPDDEADLIINTIQWAAHTGLPADGLILVSNILDARRIRTGQSGEDAL